MTLRCAAYARYSSDLQSPRSIEDQLRICREYALSRGFTFLEEHVYADEALSGVGADRPGLGRLLAAALSAARPFDIILLDDSSRLARNTKDALTFFERLNFAGIRLIAVSQGIDSDNEQAHVLVTVHGIVDSLYVKELAKKTHRGLEGLMLRGQHTGGRCFGYDSVPVSGTTGKQLVINESEAAVIRRIFEMSAEGQSLKTIAKTLNHECVPPPRPRADNRYGTWCHTCIREMLRRDLYRGKVIWNSSRFVKTPGTNKRVRRPRPESEWRIVSHPELQIVSDELWQRVQERQKTLMATYGGAKSGGVLMPRSATSPYLLSGILKREAIEYVLDEFGNHVKKAFANLSNQLAQMRERKEKLEGELRRLAETAAATGPSAFLVAAIHEREQQLRDITDQLLAGGDNSVDAHLLDIRSFVTRRLGDLRTLLSGDPVAARKELLKHVSEIRMMPQARNGDEKPHYVAEGKWNLLGHEKEDFAGETSRQIRVVAGAGFEPATFGV